VLLWKLFGTNIFDSKQRKQLKKRISVVGLVDGYIIWVQRDNVQSTTIIDNKKNKKIK
jgi:hypothetical protein